MKLHLLETIVIRNQPSNTYVDSNPVVKRDGDTCLSSAEAPRVLRFGPVMDKVDRFSAGDTSNCRTSTLRLCGGVISELTSGLREVFME